MKRNLFCVSKKWVYLTFSLLVVLSAMFLVYKVNKATITKNSEAGFLDCVVTYDANGNKVVKNPQKCCQGKSAKNVCAQSVIGGGAHMINCQTGMMTKFNSYTACTQALQKTQPVAAGRKAEVNGRPLTSKRSPRTQDQANKPACPENSDYKCYIGKCEDYNKVTVKLYEETNYSCPKTQGFDQKCCRIVYATPTPLPAATAEFTLKEDNIYKVTATRGTKNEFFYINMSPKVTGGSGYGYCELDRFPMFPIEDIAERGIEFGDMDVYLMPKVKDGVLGFEIKDSLSNKIVLSQYFVSTPVWAIYLFGGWQCVQN